MNSSNGGETSEEASQDDSTTGTADTGQSQAASIDDATEASDTAPAVEHWRTPHGRPQHGPITGDRP